MERIFNLDEAAIWFLRHHQGNVICVKENEEKEISSYPDAIYFYENED